MKTIQEYLGITQQQYDDMVLQMFLNWAQHYIVKCTDWQNLIANAAISKWFRRELTELEKDFIEEVEAYDHSHTVTRLDYHNIYHRCTLGIHELQPKPNVEAAKKVPGTIHTMRSNGIVLFTYLDRN